MDFHNSCCSAVRNKSSGESPCLACLRLLVRRRTYICCYLFGLYSVNIVQGMQNRSEPVHSVRCLARTLSMDSIVLIQNSYGSLFHVCWVGNKALNLYLQLCSVIIVRSYMESQKYCTALLSPFIFYCCCNISKTKYLYCSNFWNMFYIISCTTML